MLEIDTFSRNGKQWIQKENRIGDSLKEARGECPSENGHQSPKYDFLSYDPATWFCACFLYQVCPVGLSVHS